MKGVEGHPHWEFFHEFYVLSFLYELLRILPSTGEKIVDTRTKLYFGSLPYGVDSAQLAGLIEDYGSAELIEVLNYLTLFNSH
jgi:hypothetical protein